MPLSTIASNQIKNDTIVDADINSSSNIATSKLGTGAIVQGVNIKLGSQTAGFANSTDWHGTGFGKSITPTSSSNKILVLCSINLYQGTASKYYSVNLYRHSAAFTANGAVSGTQLFNNNRGFGTAYGNGGDRFVNLSCSLLDSPSTTSEIYYNVCHKEESGGSGIFDGYDIDSSITLLEVVG